MCFELSFRKKLAKLSQHRQREGSLEGGTLVRKTPSNGTFHWISTSSVLSCLKNNRHITTIKVPSCNGIFFPLALDIFSCFQNQIFFLPMDADLPKVLWSPFQGPGIYPNVPLTLISRVFSTEEGRREGNAGCWPV